MPRTRGRAMPTLELERHDDKMMQELAVTLLHDNLEQWSSLALTSDGHPDSRYWSPVQKREGIRVYKETTRQQQDRLKSTAAMGGGATSKTNAPSSLLLKGSIVGNLDDVMYATAASSTMAMRIKAKCTDDGSVDSKVLARVVQPTMAEPFNFLNVTWREFALSEPRDYVCLDAAGLTSTEHGEKVGYHLIHSVGFDALPDFTTRGVARANMSVCWIFRQVTSTHVECYARGFYDFDTNNTMLNSISLHTTASQWLSCTKLVQCAQVKKLARLLHNGQGPSSSEAGSFESDSGDDRGGSFSSYENGGYNPSGSRTGLGSTSSSGGHSVSLMPAPPAPAKIPSSRCKICCKAFRFLGASRRECKACDETVCSRCTVKQSLFQFSRSQKQVVERKKIYCKQCVNDAMCSDAHAVARDDLVTAMNAQETW